MKVLLNLAWTLVLLVFSFGIGAFYVIGKSNSVFHSFEHYQEEFVLAGISFVIFSILLGLFTLFVTKLLKSKNKVKISLIVVSIVVVIFGVQAYFIADDVLLIKERAILWEDNEEELISEINNDLLKQGYDKEQSADYAECIIDRIKLDDDYFYTITEKQDMILFIIHSNEYIEYKNRCVKQQEMTIEEQEAKFEEEMKELLGE